MITVHIIDQMQWAQDSFTFVMDTLNHDSAISFEDKAAMVENYKAFFPLWPHNIIQLEEALDRINPAYQGRAKWRICGEIFWVIKGNWQECADNSVMREDSYLLARTGTIYTIECALVAGTIATVKINSEVVWRGSGYAKNELAERGVNALLILLDLLPF